MARSLWNASWRLGGCALLFALAGCATNPVSGKREFSLVSEAQELQLGREGDKAVAGEYGLYDDAALAAYVDSIGQKLAKVSHRPDLAWHFQIVDDAAVNAFALPGGYVYVTRGILAHLNSEAQLAGVLGHEIGHVTARHSAQRMTYQQLASLGMGVAGALSPSFRRYSGPAEQALGLVFLKYSRDDENQADELGVGYAAKASYDPTEIPATYAMLKRVSERSGQRIPTFLSTHPDPGDREARTTALAKAAIAGKSGLVVRQRIYLQRVEGVAFGDDPRQGYFDGDVFVHPVLRFQLTLPNGWQRQNGKSALTAVKSDQSAALQLTLVEGSTLSPADYVASLQRNGKIAGARGGTETIGGFAAWVGRLSVTAQDGSTTMLVGAFIRNSPETMYQMLGKSAQPDDADFGRILAAARSFGPVSDPARLGVLPDRVRLRTVKAPAPFASLLAGFGAQALDVEGTAILNNVGSDETVLAGQTLKIVVPGRPR